VTSSSGGVFDDYQLKIEPSPFVARFAAKIAECAGARPILDVACGSGRNALLLAELGCEVICIDKSLKPLQQTRDWLKNRSIQLSERLLPLELDLSIDPWPFSELTVGGIINVHFLLPRLLPFFKASLAVGGTLLIETIPAHGGNYHELPRRGHLRNGLEGDFEILVYKEREAGPTDADKVVVKVLAEKTSELPTTGRSEVPCALP
jgi:SAM-dependent methyltransferase